MPQPTQANRRIAVETPLGKDVLILTGFSGQEEMSRLFSYRLNMVSLRDAIAATDLVGKNISFSAVLPDGSPRHFNGFVSRLWGGGLARDLRTYQVEVVPWLWFLTRTADCRIFQKKTVPQIVEQVFQDLGFKDYDTSKLKGSFPEWEYCVQYRETDFNFVSRLMEQEGIFYFFEHRQGKHTLVLGNQTGAYRDLPESKVEFRQLTGGHFGKGALTSWEHQYEFCTGKWAQTDYNFETPSTDLMTKTNSMVKLPGIDKYEVYDYPGEYANKSDGAADTKLRMEQEETSFDVAHGVGNCYSFAPGGKFTLTKHPSKAEEGKNYVVTSVQHAASQPIEVFSTAGGGGAGEEYHNAFTCIPASIVFRPARITPKPIISGAQTAVVVGPAGEEIHCDKYGRVKVQFHWDREGKKDEKSSLFVRVAHSVAGKKWGFVSIPRIGQEVVVHFLEGDPDRPLIVGSVYNNDQMPHYDLPAEQTKSYIKTNSSKGGDGFNELRVEDKAGKEQIFVHAQRNMDVRVKNDSLEQILNNRHQIIGSDKDGKKTGDQRELVYQDKHLNIKRHHVEHVEGNMQLTIGQGEAQGGKLDLLIEKNKTETIGGDHDLHVKKNRNEKVDGTASLSVGGDLHEKVGQNQALEAGQAVHIKAGTTLILEAGAQLSLKGPGGFIDIGPAGISIVGTMVMINSGGAAGNGAGAKPQAPQDAKPAQPTKPDQADDSKTGYKSCPG